MTCTKCLCIDLRPLKTGVPSGRFDAGEGAESSSMARMMSSEQFLQNPALRKDSVRELNPTPGCGSKRVV